jgi:DNA-directed RNA polymerase subunit RPC12/RpoP
VFTARYGFYIPSGLTFTNSTFCPHSVFMCFVWISEQTAIISLYSINWLVFIAETECVYCAVRTLYSARFNIHKFYVLPTQCIYVFLWISEQTAIISLYSINWLVFITETECVYCAVRTLYSVRFNIHKFYLLPTQCVYVFCVDLRTKSDYFPVQH